jgi:hypothetical protein
VMGVELSVEADFATLPASTDLNKEVKAMKTWLAGSELFGAPQLLNDGPQPGLSPSEPLLAVKEATEKQAPIGAVLAGDLCCDKGNAEHIYIYPPPL